MKEKTFRFSKRTVMKVGDVTFPLFFHLRSEKA